MKKLSAFAALGLVALTALPAAAHFQMVYTPESALEKGAEIPLRLVFTHPFEAGHTMEMGKPEQFFVINKGKKTDLLDTLQPITFTSLENSGAAYSTTAKVRSLGDYVFGFVPAPYYEQSEDVWMQQVTKMVVNVGGLPTDWSEPTDLPVEIVPLAQPYALWTGNTFRGTVMADGKPVPGAEIEVEYMNHEVDLDKNAFGEKEGITNAKDAFVTQVIMADENGNFSYSFPKAGWWGFAALGVRSYEADGHTVDQDAVIWVQVTDAK